MLKQPAEAFDKLMVGGVVLLAAAFLITGLLGFVVIVGLQCYGFLKSGAWPSVSIALLLTTVLSPPADSWLVSPTDWLGVHRAITFLPASLGVLGTGMGLGTLLYRLVNDVR